MIDFGKRLSNILQTKKITQSELARRMGVPPQTISKYITNERANPTLNTVDEIARALDVPLVSLISRDRGSCFPANENHITNIEYVIDRYGNKREFDPDLIRLVISRATGRDVPDDAMRDILKYLLFIRQKENKTLTTDRIDEVVETVLITSGYSDMAKLYRADMNRSDNARSIRQLFLAYVSVVEDYVGNKTWEIKENANMSYSLQGLNNHIFSVMSSQYWLDKIYTKEIKHAHISGDFHIHDLGLLAGYCCGWDLKALLTDGFRGASGKVVSAPPKHFRTALGQIVNFFYTLQGESAGAQALSSFDTLLAPFIHYDKLTYQEVLQAMQEFIYNMNVPTRVGFQTPFTNITMDLKIPKSMENEAVVVGGELKDKTYGEFQKEVDWVNMAFCEVMMKGDDIGKVFTFPIPTYNITKDFDWDNPNNDLLWEMTAKYGIPYFANFVNSDMDPDDARSMCCRLRLDNRELRKRGGGLFGSNPLTGSIGVVTLNLPRLGYKSEDFIDFFDSLLSLMNLAKDSLIIKRNYIEHLTEQGLYPYSKFYLRDIKSRMGSYWKNHYNTIGIVGMNECCLNFLGKPLESKEGLEFSKKVLNFMRETLIKFQEETGDLFNLEATPAESTAYRLALKDRKAFPDILQNGTNKVGYYTNSTQLPASTTTDLFEALVHQNELQPLYTGGTVHHIYLGEKLSSGKAAKMLVKKVISKFEIPYISITPTFSICPEHGYIPGEHRFCPKCG